MGEGHLQSAGVICAPRSRGAPTPECERPRDPVTIQVRPGMGCRHTFYTPGAPPPKEARVALSAPLPPAVEPPVCSVWKPSCILMAGAPAFPTPGAWGLRAPDGCAARVRGQERPLVPAFCPPGPPSSKNASKAPPPSTRAHCPNNGATAAARHAAWSGTHFIPRAGGWRRSAIAKHSAASGRASLLRHRRPTQEPP